MLKYLFGNIPSFYAFLCKRQSNLRTQPAQGETSLVLQTALCDDVKTHKLILFPPFLSLLSSSSRCEEHDNQTRRKKNCFELINWMLFVINLNWDDFEEFPSLFPLKSQIFSLFDDYRWVEIIDREYLRKNSFKSKALNRA